MTAPQVTAALTAPIPLTQAVLPSREPGGGVTVHVSTPVGQFSSPRAANGYRVHDGRAMMHASTTPGGDVRLRS